jgi:hypothetical protein
VILKKIRNLEKARWSTQVESMTGLSKMTNLMVSVTLLTKRETHTSVIGYKEKGAETGRLIIRKEVNL